MPTLNTSKRVALFAVPTLTVFSITLFVPRSTQAAPPATNADKTTQKSPPAASRSTGPDRHATRGQYLARTALSYRGLPYRWGGTSPRSGFDCSGMVQFVCAKWGIYLPRTGSEQFHQGVAVPKESLQAGDLVFFKNTYKRGLSHVGIYVGEGWFIHAAGRKLGVMLSRLDQGYHKAHWAGARRLNLSKLPPVEGETPVTPDHVVLDSGASEGAGSGDDKPAE